MGNTGIKKLLFSGDYCETHYESIHEIEVMDLDRNSHSLCKYNDKVVLIVNVGQSKQSEIQLQKLKELKSKYTESLEVLGFPSDQFRYQSNPMDAIRRFYYEDNDVNFPILSKVDVNGPYTDYLYRYLKRNSELYDHNLLTSRMIQSDYCKFLVDRQGRVRQFYTLNHDFNQIETDLHKLL